MASSGGAFSETLQSITTTKLRELSKKRLVFEDQKSALLLSTRLEKDQKARIRQLLDGVKQCFSIRTDRRGQIVTGSITDSNLEVKLKNLERFLQQSYYDPSVSSELLQDWDRVLVQQLNVQTLKYQYATLYGELVTEWLSVEKESPALPDNVSEESEVFERAARKEKLEQRLQWENSVFKPFNTDREDIEFFLEKLFSQNAHKQAFKGLKALRKSVDTFETELSTPYQFNEPVLKWTIQGLTSSDLLTDEQRSVLKDFISNPVILSEISDVLNMRMVALQNWGWDGDIPIDQRRHLSGKYKVYMHEDLLQAIFLQFIGVKWSVFFKRTFTAFSSFDGAWTPLQKPIPKLDRMRRDYYLGHQEQWQSVQAKRDNLYKSSYFMSKLLDSETQDVSMKDGEEEAEYGQLRPKRRRDKKRAAPAPAAPPAASRMMLARRPAVSSEDEEDEEYPTRPPQTKNPMQAKQFLLHLLSTEILVNTQLHGEFTCIHSEFEDWGQNLPHSTILQILGFLGVSEKWLSFFTKFLQAPLKFANDGSSVQSQIRRRGVPESHVLSDVFGEVVLFCMDYSVNQATSGGQLHRIHNDFWFWSSSHETCIKAWTAVEEFAETMGVSINEGKSGSERILRDKEELPTLDEALPQGDIRWGFLYLNGTEGRFVIDQTMVDKHTEELQRQLEDKAKSVFSWVQAWNAYAGTFFTTNFGKPANCYGQKHVDSMLATLERIQRSIFTGDGGVAGYLKDTIHERFGISDIPDGYIYFPTSLGGLELESPFIPLLQIRGGICENPINTITVDFAEAEANAYRQAKQTFLNGTTFLAYDDTNFKPANPDNFMPFEEFVRYREEYNCGYTGNLREVFDDLLKQPTEESVEVGAFERVALQSLGHASGGIGEWNSMTPYWRWVVQLYGPDMIERFGGFSIVDRGLLPIGMVNLFRSGRVKWQG